MFEHLRDPAPPTPDAAARDAVADRARSLTRHRTLARAGAGVLGALVVAAAVGGTLAALGDDGAGERVEVAGVQERATTTTAAPTTTTTTAPPATVPVAPPTTTAPPPPESAPTAVAPTAPPAPTETTLTVTVVTSFPVVDCRVDGVPYPGTSFTVTGLSPGATVFVECQGETSPPGAATAAATSVVLVTGPNTVTVTL